jgi:hypothetical protein
LNRISLNRILQVLAARLAEQTCGDSIKTLRASPMALMATVITNLANMRHEMLKSVAQNLRA